MAGAIFAIAVIAIGAVVLVRTNDRDELSMAQQADAIGADIMTLVARGDVADRVGQVIMVPKPNFYLGPDRDLTHWETSSPELFTSHPNPWRYLTSVPLILYGPRWAPPATPETAVDLTDLAPTYARLMGMPFDAEGTPLRGIRYSGSRPRLIMTIVLDGGGWNVLDEHPGSWTNIRAIGAGGLTYQNALNGSFPSQTAAIHANIGTGTYPRTHGVATNQYFENGDPHYLRVPTVGELWDETNGNRPLVGTVSVLSIHLGMVGHGAQRPTGDRDIAVFWDEENGGWTTDERYYELPEDLRTEDEPRLRTYEKALDQRDGLNDGLWFGHTLKEVRDGVRRTSAASFAPYMGDDVLTVLRDYEWGRDDLTDLFYVEFKMPDEGGHFWGMDGGEEGDIVAAVDEQIGRIKHWLGRFVGKRNYVLAITADHGQQPIAQDVGGWMINSRELERDIEAEFGEDIRVRTHYIRIPDEGKVDPTAVSRFLSTYTIEDNIPSGTKGSDRVPDARLDERVFAGAFTTTWIDALTEGEIEAFGTSDYEEGELERVKP